MPNTTPEQNKAIVLEAFETLFNKRDYKAAERYWSPNYIQHSAHIEPGREGLFNLTKGIPSTLRYEAGTIVADGNFVIVHRRSTGLRRTFFALKTASLWSIGTSFKMKQPRSNPRARLRCSATGFRNNMTAPSLDIRSIRELTSGGTCRI
jgi:predicted SnoaL-like aldol condensation-catalyzing enzyme